MRRLAAQRQSNPIAPIQVGERALPRTSVLIKSVEPNTRATHPSALDERLCGKKAPRQAARSLIARANGPPRLKPYVPVNRRGKNRRPSAGEACGGLQSDRETFGEGKKNITPLIEINRSNQHAPLCNEGRPPGQNTGQRRPRRSYAHAPAGGPVKTY